MINMASPKKRDNVIVYGVACTWWDDISQVATTKTGIPCCPVCGSMLLETSPDDWKAGAEDMETKQPGYIKILNWGRGKCFKNYQTLLKEWVLHGS